MKYILKKILLTSFLLVTKLSFSQQELRFVVPYGLPSMATTYMNKEQHTSLDNLKYIVEKNSTALINSIIKEEADFAIIPSSFAPKLLENKIPYSVLGTVGWGSFYLVGYDNLNSLSDLSNQEIVLHGKGLTPSLISNYILTKNEIKDIKFQYLTSPNEVSLFFLSKKYKYAIIPEPMLSKLMLKDSNIKILMNFNQEWKKITNSDLGYPQSTLIVKENILKNNNILVEKFILELKKSIDFLKNNSSDSMYSEWIINNKTIFNSNLFYVPSKDTLKEYQMFFELIGGDSLDSKTSK
ncbi:MAG: ABC transporter substrate-binding protein [Fusobacteriaceae bacterium]